MRDWRRDEAARGTPHASGQVLEACDLEACGLKFPNEIR
jgi:hypothetical protein